jgi:hypothetical protein
MATMNEEHRVEQVAVTADKIAYQRYHNPDQFLKVFKGEEAGDCLPSSFETWCKLRKIGAIRVRGKRGLEQRQEIGGRKNSWHYWVEAKGMVYDRSSGVTLLMTKENYYKTAEVVGVEKAEYVGLFDDELDGCTPEDKQYWNVTINSLNTSMRVLFAVYETLAKSVV